jgi:hypothetical protein
MASDREFVAWLREETRAGAEESSLHYEEESDDAGEWISAALSGRQYGEHGAS